MQPAVTIGTLFNCVMIHFNLEYSNLETLILWPPAQAKV